MTLMNDNMNTHGVYCLNLGHLRLVQQVDMEAADREANRDQEVFREKVEAGVTSSLGLSFPICKAPECCWESQPRSLIFGHMWAMRDGRQVPHHLYTVEESAAVTQDHVYGNIIISQKWESILWLKDCPC